MLVQLDQYVRQVVIVHTVVVSLGVTYDDDDVVMLIGGRFQPVLLHWPLL